MEGEPELRATQPEHNPGCVQKALLGREAKQNPLAGNYPLLARPLYSFLQSIIDGYNHA